MIPVDANSYTGLDEIEREYRGLGKRGGDDAMVRHTFLPSPTKVTRSLPRRSTRLAAANSPFKGAKRSRRSLKLPTRVLIHAQLRAAERSRALIGETSSPVVSTVEVTGSKVDPISTAKSAESDDAVVPRCINVAEDTELGRGQEQRRNAASTAPAAVAGVILSAPVAPKDAKRPCCCRHHPQHQQHHQHPHPQHHHHQQQQQHLSPGCQMSHPSATLVDRVPSNPRLINIPIPDDPRQWSRLDVRTWLDHVRRVYNIRDLDLDRFPMNGKALCIMSKDMFVYRVPQGGIPLYIDFQLRFSRALGFR